MIDGDASRTMRAAELDGAPPLASGTLALVGARLLDESGRLSETPVAVIARDGRIAEIVDDDRTIKADWTIDIGGRTLLPGLVDAHVHASSFELPEPGQGRERDDDEVRPYAQAVAASDFLAGGVTTIRDVGAYGRTLFGLRSAAGLGLCRAPRMLLCGQIVSVSSPGGRRFTTMYREADGPDELRKATREQLRQGADFIKFMSTGALTVHGEPVAPAQMTREEVDAIVEEAHRMDARVASHAEGLEGTRLSVEAGVDTIEHGEQLYRAPDVLEQMAASGVFYVPTLSVFHVVSEERACCFTPHLVEQAKRLQDDAYRSVAAARSAGVRIAMGFDCSPHGANALELVRLGDAGLTASELVAAGTSTAADACGLLDVGRVAPGALADLLVVSGNPLQDISVLAERSSIWLVLQGGVAVAGSSLGDPRTATWAGAER